MASRSGRYVVEWPIFRVLLVTSSVVSCAPDDVVEPRAEAEVYILEYCEGRIGKCEACSPVPESWDAACDYDACVDAEWSRYDDIPCFQQELEFDRCRFERLDCSDYFAMTIDTGPSSQCYSFVERTVACLEASD